MIDRRMLATLLASAAVAPALSPRPSWGQAAKSKAVFYASVGSELTLYGMNVGDATLEKRGAVTLPANVQYAWPHPSKQYFYVVSSGGGPGVASDKNFANAFQIDPATGALTPHGQPQNLPSRPIHTSVDIAGEYLLTAYNDPSSLTVHRINRDGTLGARVDQPNRLDTGKYAHQIRATPDNQQVILVTRGNNAPGDNPVNPGSLKTFAFKDGVLTQLAAIQPGDGMHFGPRHLDFHPTQPWVYGRSRARTSFTSTGAMPRRASPVSPSSSRRRYPTLSRRLARAPGRSTCTPTAARSILPIAPPPRWSSKAGRYLRAARTASRRSRSTNRPASRP